MAQNTTRFSKMHGLGNDFMIIETLSQTFEPRADLIQQWSDRHCGVGFDQLLLITPPPSPDIDFGYRIFNADGSEVQQCGNGARCLAQFVRQRGLSTKNILRVTTPTNLLTIYHEPDGRIKVDMGRPDFSPSSLPFTYPQKQLRYELEIDSEMIYFGAVSMGNPHIVIAVPALDAVDILKIGASLSLHPAFPERVNVSFMQRLTPKQIKLRVYERGAGETLACGTAACAAVVIGQCWEMLDTRVDVLLPGGNLTIDWQIDANPVYMTGSAHFVFDGEITA